MKRHNSIRTAESISHIDKGKWENGGKGEYDLHFRTLLRPHVLAWITVIALLITALIASPGFAVRSDERGRQLLLNGLRADKETSYTAEQRADVVVKGKHRIVVSRIFHRAPDKTRTEYLSPEDLAGTILVRKGTDAYRCRKQGKEWYPTRWGLQEDHTDLLLKNYRVQYKGNENIEGRPANIVSITPKYPGNPSKTIWFDRKTGILLQSVLRNYRHEAISTVRLSKVDTGPNLNEDLFEVKAAPKKPRHRSHHHNRKPIFPGYLPRGYVQTGVSDIHLRDFFALHLKFSDGLNTISLFERNGKTAERPADKDREPLSHALKWTEKGWEFTLIADLAPEELKKIADSIKVPDE